MSPINDIFTAPLSPGEPGFRSRDVVTLGMDDKDFDSTNDAVDPEPLNHHDHHHANSISEDFPALMRSPIRDGTMHQQHMMQEGVMAAPQNFSHHQHNMPNQHQTMSFDGNGGMQPSMMWNVDPSVRHPGEKPKRPLSAYNFYFQLERERIIKGDIKDKDLIGEYTLEDVARIALIQQKKAKENKPKEKRSHRKTHGKISFGDLARTIANKWKKLEDKTKAIFEGSASIEKERYKKELAEWNKQHKKWKDATTQLSTMGHMMFPGADASGFNIVTPTQMPKQTMLGSMSGISESTSANDAMAIAMMNQRLMNEYSERSATSVRSHPSMMQPNPTQSSGSSMSPGRRASTGGMSSSMSAQGHHQQQQQQQQQQHRYSMDFFDNGGDDIMHGSGNMGMRDISYLQVADDAYNSASSTLSSPTSSPNDFHNRAIISQQRQMQIMLMQRQQKMMQQQQQQQQQRHHHQQQQQQHEPSSAAMMQQMMMMKQYGSNSNLSGMVSGRRQEHHDTFLHDDHHSSTFKDGDKNDMDGSNNSSNNKTNSSFAGQHHHQHQV